MPSPPQMSGGFESAISSRAPIVLSALASRPRPTAAMAPSSTAVSAALVSTVTPKNRKIAAPVADMVILAEPSDTEVIVNMLPDKAAVATVSSSDDLSKCPA